MTSIVSDQLHVKCSHCGQFLCTMHIGDREKATAKELGYMLKSLRVSIICGECHQERRGLV